MEDSMSPRRKNSSNKAVNMGENYNVQGWVDVKKLVAILSGMNSDNIRVNTISAAIREMVDMVFYHYQRKGIPEPETIAIAYQWLYDSGYTVAQLENGDKRINKIVPILTMEDRIIDSTRKFAEQPAVNEEVSGDIDRVANIKKTIEDKINEHFDSSLLIVSPNTDKYPTEPEEHKGTCRHRGLILDDGINCNKCGFFVPNEIETSEVEDNEKEKEI